MKNYDGLRACSRKCIELETECPCTECRLWIDYPDEKNYPDEYYIPKTSFSPCQHLLELCNSNKLAQLYAIIITFLHAEYVALSP